MAWDLQANRVEDWLPESFEETQQLLWFVERFGSDELLMVSWDGCTFDDPRLREFSQKLREAATHNGRSVQWFHQVWTGLDVLEMLTSDPINVTHKAAIARMQGWLVGPDSSTTCAVALVSPAGSANREAAVEYAFQVADSVEGLSRAEIHLAGPTYDSVAINQASKSSLLQFNLWSFLICIIWIFACLKSVKLAWSVFVTALFSQQVSMALMYYSGGQMDSVLLLVANLTFVLTIAGGVHLVNYYLDARRSEQERPVTMAVSAARWPTLMAAATTALGMVSLCVSQITPIKNFGAFAAVSVIAATGVLFTLLPVMLAQFPPRLRESPRPSNHDDVESTRWLGLARAVVRLRWGILIVAVAGLVYGVSGVTRLNTSTRLQDLFSPDAQVMQDYRWLESHVANLVPVEVVIQFPVNEPPGATRRELASNFIQRMEVVEKLRDALADVPGIGGSVTAKDFTPPMPRRGGFRQLAQRSVRTQLIYAHRSELDSLGFWRERGGDELWRISLRVGSGREVDYGRLLETLDERVEAVVDDEITSLGPEVVVCGGVPLVFKAQAQLLDDLIASFGLALLMITGVMICVLRGLISGLSAMIPNVLPSVLVFGVLGWLGWTVEIGSMLTVTVAMGIAVDDTLHFITWFRRGKCEVKGMQQVLNYAYTRCGAAVIQTSLVCSFGLVVFALSPFMPIARFAWLMFTLLLLALVCDLLVLPAVLLATTDSGKSLPPDAADERV